MRNNTDRIINEVFNEQIRAHNAALFDFQKSQHLKIFNKSRTIATRSFRESALTADIVLSILTLLPFVIICASDFEYGLIGFLIGPIVGICRGTFDTFTRKFQPVCGGDMVNTLSHLNKLINRNKLEKFNDIIATIVTEYEKKSKFHFFRSEESEYLIKLLKGLPDTGYALSARNTFVCSSKLPDNPQDLAKLRLIKIQSYLLDPNNKGKKLYNVITKIFLNERAGVYTFFAAAKKADCTVSRLNDDVMENIKGYLGMASVSN